MRGGKIALKQGIQFGAALLVVASFLRLNVAQTGAAAEIAGANEEAIALFVTGDFEGAQQRFQAKAKENPKDSEAQYYLGLIAVVNERFEDAGRYFSSARKLNSTNSLYVQWLGRAYGLDADRRKNFTSVGLLKKAKAAFEEALILDPRNLEARMDLVQFYTETPGVFGGDTKLAMAQVEAIKKLDSYLAALALGDVLKHEGKFAEAERAYHAAADKRPDKGEPFFRLGRMFQANKEYDKAFDAFGKSIEKSPTNMAAYFQIGKTGALSGRQLDRAERALHAYLNSKAVFGGPPRSWAYARLGQVCEMKGKRDEARIAYQAALRLDPDNKNASAGLKKLK